MEDIISRLFLVLVLGVIGIAVGIGLYFYRLEKIPGLRLSQVLGLLLLCRILDIGSFWWAFQSSGGEIAQAEINPIYQVLASFLSPNASFVLGLIPTMIFPIVAVVLYYRFILWGGATTQEAQRFALTTAATISALSIYGAATNAAFALFVWQSPLLIVIG
ncbi:hypothetical protein A2890_01690 [candidate division WWE3 bacterium RIFCSPLOWO2_01_FULL_53_14]|uniref:Uncharacterized protein n=1 Tax=candidate division WWE3 bacterium RIFCSPLOWO2_01_FULL_53_14 TaxID=1802628 RepID=A0A1F4VS90_UNCKA|nr:MAG: hypothetical protein A2890_01690 [candidate division WWE3 bacterium RIFCSPLOWO2_01_FULL_53_14]